MGPPHRTPSKIYRDDPQTSPNDSSETPESPVAQRQRIQPSVSRSEQPNLGMSPASRYDHNLKVLRRRDPSIVSIFDQFSHVCLYHHNGKKWEKQGFEGSMFLYERESYPPYGFYILNRMGMDDHIQRLYPEDNISAHGSYVIIRSYPEYTNRRLAVARSSHTLEIPHKFANVYATPEVPNEEKGDATTIGLWMFATDAREPLIDVLNRLHFYIKQNVPYPEEFRYGPDRPPPPNTHLRATTIVSVPPQLDRKSKAPQAPTSGGSSHSQTDNDQGYFTANHPSQTYANGSASELDKLFARIEPTPILSATVPSSTAPTSTSKMTVESLFAALGGDLMKPQHDLPSSPSLAPSSASTGISLLDSIFASVSNSSNTGPVINLTTPERGDPTLQPSVQRNSATIYSPTPSTNTLPQILNQDVISTLLGLPPSRTTSAASTTYSSGTHSHPSSREGDNEEDSDVSRGRGIGGSDGYSESSTVLDPDAEFDDELQSAGASAGRPLLSGQTPTNIGFLGTQDHGRTLGDVTPRAPLNGFITPPLARPNGARFHAASITGTGASTAVEPSSSVSTINGSHRPPSRSYSRNNNSDPHRVNGAPRRPLVPFEADSELWPYPRNPVDDTDGEEIIELDFEDTSALSDPNAFKKALRHGKKLSVGSRACEVTHDGESLKRGKKKGKKERAAEQQRVREQIENSWDVPGPSSRSNGDVGLMPDSGPASPSLGSPLGNMTYSASGRTASVPAPILNPLKTTNGIAAKPRQVRGNGLLVREDLVKDSFISALSDQESLPEVIQRNEFVREVLTLIHTNKAFVDTLYQDYINKLA